MNNRHKVVWLLRKKVADDCAKAMNEKVQSEQSYPEREYIVERARLWGHVPFGWDVVKYLTPEDVNA